MVLGGHRLARVGDCVDLDLAPGLRDFDRPSSTDWLTGRGGRDGTRSDRRDGWRDRLDAADCDAGTAILDMFGLRELVESDERA